jgi:hypothetical protein
MPLRAMPATIELTDWSQGYVPKPDDPGVPPEALLDAMNMVLDPATGTTHSRPGFKRLFDIEGQAGFRIYTLHPYRRMDGKEYIICVLSRDSETGADNIKVMAYDIVANSWTKISPAVEWNGASGRHWGATIDGAFYGGAEKDPMYRWFPGHVARGAWATGTNYNRGDSVTKGGVTYTALRDHTSHDGTGGTIDSAPDANNRHARLYWTTEWKSDVGTPQDYPEWVEPGVGTTSDTERARDYAFKLGDVVKYNWNSGGDNFTKNFEAKRDIRYDKWDADNKKYKKGDKVSTKYDIDSKGAYWRSWECVETHAPEVANQPGSGGGMWKKVKLSRPMDDDGEINDKDWGEMAAAPQTHIAVWWANRLFARSDKPQTLLYSRVAKVGQKDNRGKAMIGKAGDPEWDPDDWRARGIGPAGFLPFETPEGDDITALVPYGDYMAVFKRYSTHIISGRDPETWRVRPLGNIGASYVTAACEYEGLVYFISDRGFYVTEGTQISPVPGSEKLNAYIQDALDFDAAIKDVRLFPFGGFLWIVMPRDRSGNPGQVILYHKPTGSFWPLDIQMQAACVQRYQGSDHLFFSTVNDTGVTVGATYTWDEPGDKPRSKSERDIGGTVHRNTFLNPNFAAEEDSRPLDWQPTDEAKVALTVTKAAGRGPKKGLLVSNKRKPDSTAGLFNGWEGFFQDHTDETPPSRWQSIYVRRANWQKHPKKRPQLKYLLDLNPLWVDELVDSNFTYKGNGWWRASVEILVTDEVNEAAKGFLIPPGADYHFDMAMNTTADTGYFDGNGGTSADYLFEGADRPYLMLYDHPEAGDQDDTQDDPGTMRPIKWFMRTAWLTFGALQEERRIRRLWGMVRGAGVVVALRSFINFKDTPEGELQTTVQTDVPLDYHEAVLPPDCHSISVSVEGESAPAAVVGVALDTEPRRIRFGRR